MYEQPEHENEGYTEVFAWGSNRQKQLGVGQRGTQPLFPIPKLQSFGITIAQIACGAEHSGFVASNGLIFMFGSNAEGQLGVGDQSLKASDNPLLIESLSGEQALSLSCGAYHTAAVTEKGDVYAWGAGDRGALGYGGHENQSLPVRAASHGGVLRGKAVACGDEHTLVLDVNGKALGAGSNEHGQLGTGTKDSDCAFVPVVGLTERISGLAAGTKHSLFLTESGKALAAGLNHKGQLGTGDTHNQSVPVEVKAPGLVFKALKASSFSAGLTDTGDVYLWGENPSFGESLTPAKQIKLEKVLALALGAKFATAVDLNGAVYTWGTGQQGELGLGSYETTEEPELVGQLEAKQATSIAAGANHVIALGQHVLPSARLPHQMSTASNLQAAPSVGSRTSPAREGNAALRHFPSRGGLDRSASPFQTNDRRLLSSSRYVSHDAPRDVDDLQARLTAERIRRQSRQLDTSAPRERPLEAMLEENREHMRQRSDLARVTSKMTDMEHELDTARRDNRNLLEQLRQLKEDRKADSGQLHSMLKEYETKMALEIDSKHAMVKQKSKEIAALHDHITRLEGEVASERLQRQRLQDFYSDQIDKVNNSLHMAERQLGMTSAEAEEMKGRTEADASRIGALTSNVTRMNERITALELENKHLQRKMANELELNARLKDELIAESERANGHETELNNVREALSGVSKQYDDHAGQTVAEIENLRATVNDLNYNKNDLVNQINSAHQEKEDLFREITTWKDLVNKLTEENTQLKLIIEDLEQKNKRFSETLNTHLYNRAAEFKARAINALKNSASPFRGRTPEAVVSPARGMQTPNRVIRPVQPGSASTSTQPLPSAQRLNRLLAEEPHEGTVKDLVKTDHDETAALREPVGEPAKQGFDYGNVLDRGQYGPNRDPRLVNSNYALIGTLDGLERGAGLDYMQPPPTTHNPGDVTPDRREEAKEGGEATAKRAPRVEEPIGAGSTSTTPVRVPREPVVGPGVLAGEKYDPTKPPESGRLIGDPTYYRVDPTTRQIERNRELDNRFAHAQDSTARLTEMLGVESPIRKSVARHNMSSPTRRVADPEQKAGSPAHPLSAGVGLPYASYYPEAASPNVVGNPVASSVTAQMVRSTMQKVKAQLEQNREANQNVSEGLVEYEKRMQA